LNRSEGGEWVMGRYLQEATHHAGKIKYYYDHAGNKGFSQAQNHYSKLCDLIYKANKSKNDKNDVVEIQSLKVIADSLMEKMKEREIKEN
jgi:hypothetical protein